MRSLSSGVEGDVRQAMWRSYLEKKGRLLHHPDVKKQTDEWKAVMLDVLALTVFHDTVIVSITGGTQLLRSVIGMGGAAIQVGGDRLDARWAAQARASTRQFQAILRTYQLTPADLVYTGPDDFVLHVKSLMARW